MDYSPFGRLSPELRNRIYELVLIVEGQTYENAIVLGAEDRAAKALTQTCQQIRSESRIMFFALNGLFFTWSDGHGDGEVSNILEQIGADALCVMESLQIRIIYMPTCLKDLFIVGGDRTAELRAQMAGLGPTSESWIRPERENKDYVNHWCDHEDCEDYDCDNEDHYFFDSYAIGYAPVSKAWEMLRVMGLEIETEISWLPGTDNWFNETWYVRKASERCAGGDAVDE